MQNFANLQCPHLLLNIPGKRWYSSKGWTLPEGYDTGISIYNSAVREKVTVYLAVKL